MKITWGMWGVKLKQRTEPGVSWASDGNACEDPTATVCRVQTPQYVTTDQFTALTDQVKSLVHTVEKLQLQSEHFQSTYMEHQRTRTTAQPPSLLERKPNHFQLQPSQMHSQSPSPTRGAVGPCFKCGGSGHLRKDCMNHSDKDIGQQPQSGVSISPDNQPQGLQIGCTKNKGESLQIPVTVKVTFKIASKLIDWYVHVVPIRDSALLGYDLLKAHDVVVYARGKVFIGDELVPSKVVTDGADYCVTRVTLGKSTTIPPTSECVVWGEVENPKPGVPAVLEPLTITGALASGSVAVTMGKQVPVRLCNFSTSKAALSKGACLGLLVEAYLEEPSCFPEKSAELGVKKESESVLPLRVGRIATISDLPDHLRGLVGATSEVLTEEQYQRFLQLLLIYQTLFAKSDSDLGYMSAITHKIDTGTAKLVRQPVKRTLLGFQSEEEKHLQAMLKAGVITPSAST